MNDLLASIKDQPVLNRYAAIRHFNEVTLLRRNTVSGHLSHIAKIEDPSYDRILLTVISTLASKDWKELYGLNLKETMSLPFSTYLLLNEELKKHTARINAQLAATASANINNEQ